MKNRNYILNRERLTRTEIEQYKDFDEVLAKVSAGSGTGVAPKSGFFTLKSAFIAGGIGLAACLTIIAIFKSDKPELGHSFTSDSNESEIKKEKFRVHAPFPELDVAFEEYTIDAEVDVEIETRNGSLVWIEKNCFELLNGDLPKGKITIKYREFHNAVDIFRAGIPLEYDSAGKEYTFISAGMFEITAFKGDEPLKLIDGKALTVDLVTQDTSAGFNSYFLDTSLGNWVYTGENKAKPEQKDHVLPIDRTRGSIVMNTGISLLNTLAVKPAIPGLPKIPKGKYGFTIEFSKGMFPELPANVQFVVDDELSDFNQIYYDVTWDKVDLKRSSHPDRYTLELTKGDEVISVQSYPALNDQDYAKAWAEYREAKAAYDKYMADQKAGTETGKSKPYSQEELDQMAEVRSLDNETLKVLAAKPELSIRAVRNKAGQIMRRTFAIYSLGVHNSDHPKYRSAIFPSGVILVPVLINALKNRIPYIKGNNAVKGINTVLTFYNGGNTVISSTNKNVFWAVTKDLKIAIVEDFDPTRVQSTTEITCQLYQPEEGVKKLDTLLNGKP